MTAGPEPTLPLAYAGPVKRRDSVFGMVAVALAALCASLPAWMLYQLLTGTRTRWAVYTPYAGTIGSISFGVNWPWYLLDVIAVLLAVAGFYFGRARLPIAALAIAVFNLVAVLTIVLGSPW